MSRSIKLLIIVMACCSLATSVQAQCSWVALPATIDFGTYSVFGGASNTTTTSGSVSCTGNYDVTVSSTTGAGGSYSPRRMNGAVAYNVYVNAGRTLVWGDGTAGTIQYAFSNTGGPNVYSGSAYGQVPGAQDLAPGLYTDTLAVTMAYRLSSGGAWTSLPPIMLGVRMTVTSECRADIFNLIFGNYDPFAVAPLAASSVVKVYCTKTTPATFALDNGANPSGVQKRMANAALFLNYTATLATASGTSASSLTPIGGGVTLNGAVPNAQDLAIGGYIDTLQVLVNY